MRLSVLWESIGYKEKAHIFEDSSHISEKIKKCIKIERKRQNIIRENDTLFLHRLKYNEWDFFYFSFFFFILLFVEKKNKLTLNGRKLTNERMKKNLLNWISTNGKNLLFQEKKRFHIDFRNAIKCHQR